MPAVSFVRFLHVPAREIPTGKPLISRERSKSLSIIWVLGENSGVYRGQLAPCYSPHPCALLQCHQLWTVPSIANRKDSSAAFLLWHASCCLPSTATLRTGPRPHVMPQIMMVTPKDDQGALLNDYDGSPEMGGERIYSEMDRMRQKKMTKAKWFLWETAFFLLFVGVYSISSSMNISSWMFPTTDTLTQVCS